MLKVVGAGVDWGSPTKNLCVLSYYFVFFVFTFGSTEGANKGRERRAVDGSIEVAVDVYQVRATPTDRQ